MLISIVLPCFNQAKRLSETHRRLVELAQKLNKERFEFIYVDDGSRDETSRLLYEMSLADSRVKGLRLSRNFGREAALTAGLEHSLGDAVVIMDSDLQDPPELIVQMYARWLEGYHVAYGEREIAIAETAFQRWSSSASSRFMKLLSRVPSLSDSGNFRLMDRAVVSALLQMPERDRFLRGMVTWVGFRQISIPYRRPARLGVTGLPLLQRLRAAGDLLLSSSSTPLRLAIWAGLFTIGLALLAILYALILRLFFVQSYWVRGWASLFVAILFLGGVQLLSLGIIGEYIGRIYGEVKERRPLYSVRERFGFAEKPAELGEGSATADALVAARSKSTR